MAMTADDGQDPFNLQRFIDAQENVVERAQSELRLGEKQSHWMWFVFPQIGGLGSSETARYYAISNLEEAVAYLEHPVLGRRLRECTRIVNTIRGRSARAIFGSPDDVKFRSSMTLFSTAAPHDSDFREALIRYFGGIPDQATLDRL